MIPNIRGLFGTPTPQQIEALANLCGCRPEEIESRATHPRHSQEHQQLCREQGVTHVFLPDEEPMIARAMADGIPHLCLNPEGELMRLIGVTPIYQKFVLNEVVVPPTPPTLPARSLETPPIALTSA